MPTTSGTPPNPQNRGNRDPEKLISAQMSSGVATLQEINARNGVRDSDITYAARVIAEREQQQGCCIIL